MIGQSIENYNIEKLLGQGGMGSVYQALDTSLDRIVAMKIMNPGLASNTDFLRRFKSEARVLGRLQHPHIVNVYTFRHVGAHLFIVMEYVGGGTLSDLIDRQGSIPYSRAIVLLKQALNALDFAHSSNIIHRDIKPPNILLTENHQVKITDFGLAKIQEESNNTMVTRVGMTGGTLFYMPPEQTEALSNVDHRGDLYSLGMSFYQMLAGRVPFEKGSSAFSILRIIDQQQIPEPSTYNPHIPRGLTEFVMKSIKKYPEDRFQSASDMLEALEAFEKTDNNAAPVFEKTQLYSAPPSLNETVKLDYDARKLFQKKPQEGRTSSKVGGGKSSASKKASRPPSKSNVRESKASVKKHQAPKKKSTLPAFLFALLGVGLIGGAIIVFSMVRSGTSSGTNTNPPAVAAENTSSSSFQGGETDPQPATQQPIEQSGEDIGLGSSEENERVTSSETNQPTTAQSQPNQPPERRSTQPQAALRNISIQSTPSGATVYFDGVAVGETPHNISGVEPALHRVRLQLDGYEAFEGTMDVRSQTSINPSLTPLLGGVRIRVHPFGNIYLNGEQKTNENSQWHQYELPVGSYVVRGVHPVLGSSWEKSVRITPGNVEEVLFDFSKEYKVIVLSNPLNAEIIVDGKPTGRTAPRELYLRPGNHTISVQKQGFKVVGEPIKILLEGDLEVPLEFELEESR